MKLKWRSFPILFVGIVALAVFSVGTPGVTPQEDQDQETSGRFTVNVETIVVNVLVTDRNGKPLTGLQKENFRIFEDGEEQVVQNFFPVDAPFSVGLLLDTSYSTVGKLARIQDSAIEFLDQIHPVLVIEISNQNTDDLYAPPYGFGLESTSHSPDISAQVRSTLLIGARLPADQLQNSVL